MTGTGKTFSYVLYFRFSKGDKRKLASNRGSVKTHSEKLSYAGCAGVYFNTRTGEAEASGFLWVWSQPISIKIKNKKVFLWTPHLHHGMCASHTRKINFKNWNIQCTINSCYQRTVVLTERLLVLSTSILTDGYCQRDSVDRDWRGQAIFKRDGSCYRKKNCSQQGREPRKIATSPDTERRRGGASVLQETGGFQGVERPQGRTVETVDDPRQRRAKGFVLTTNTLSKLFPLPKPQFPYL